MLLQSQPLLAADSDPTPLYPWQPALQGLAVVAVLVFATAVAADVTSVAILAVVPKRQVWGC